VVIEEIRVAANEQLEGIDHINASMGAIEQATQQNAAMVEESAAGALSLAQETQYLRSAVSVFKLGRRTGNSEANRPLALIAYA
jgi:methyl-accepting chemotaxis protein